MTAKSFPPLLKKWWFVGSFVISLVLLLCLYLTFQGGFSSVSGHQASPPPKEIIVSVHKLHSGPFERVTVQPGSVQAFQSVNLFAGVSGFLKVQKMDIGDPVKKGQVLAILDVPEVEKQVQRNAAALQQAEAHVLQLKAKVESAAAELEAADAAVPQAEHAAKAAKAWTKYRKTKLKRFQDLIKSGTLITELMLEEVQEQFEAAVEVELSAQLNVVTAKAKVKAYAKKIEQADADVVEGLAEVKVARAELEKAKVALDFATVMAPFDGVITKRNYDEGDFIHSANGGGDHLPLFKVEKIDLLRLIVQIPDEYVPYTAPGKAAFVEFDALPNKKIAATISRVAQSEDPKTRYMHVEIDLPNPDKKIFPGMYGRVTVILEKTADHLSLPSECLMGKIKDHKANVFVVKGGKAFLTPVSLGLGDSANLEILAGLKDGDQVVIHPPAALTNGAMVTVH